MDYRGNNSGALVSQVLQGLLDQAQAQPSPSPRGLLASPRSGGLLGGGAPQPVPPPPQTAQPQPARPKKQRDPNDYGFADYALGLLGNGLAGPALMALEQRQRHRADNRNRAGAEALFSDLGLNGQSQPPRRPSMQGPGMDGLPVSAPQGPPQAGPPKLSRTSVLAALTKARANGFDASPYLPTLNQMLEEQDVEGLASGAPPADRALARMDPKAYAQYLLERRKPRSGENDTIEFDPATGEYKTVYKAQPKLGDEWMVDPKNPEARIPRPGSKADPQYIRETSYNRADGQRDAAPPMWSVYGPSTGRPGEINSTGDVMGPIYGKIARGVTLTPGEQRLYEDTRRAADPLAALLGNLPGGQGVPRPAPQPRLPPPGPQQRRPGAVAQQGGVFRPTSAADMASIPKGAKFVNPADGRVLTKAR